VERPAVLVLTSTFPRWANDTEPPFVFELCRRLTPHFEVHVSAPHAPGAHPSETLNGVHVHRFRYFPDCGERLAYEGGILPKLRKKPLLLACLPFFLAAQLRSAVLLCRRHRIKVIHAHWILPQGAIALITRRLSKGGARVLCTLHGADLYGLRGGLFNRLRRAIVNGAERLTVVSRAMQRDLAGEPGKVAVVPMGVDLQGRFTPGPEPRRRQSLLFVGRMVEKKGLRYLLEAMPSIIRRCPDASLRIAGSGPLQSVFERMSRDMGLQDRVQFMGPVANTELPRLYRGAEVVVFPSVISAGGDREGFGLVLVEAMGCGCAVAASDLPAVRDILRPWETGAVFPPADAGQLAVVVARLLLDPALRETLARNGRAFVREHFDWDLIAHRYKGLLDELLTT